ncbi:MAG: winged helix-turn-helix domain-containing protein [Thermoplasmata archaeon]|nr:winged helix-turn-helix domain-containing protein [Thermoplasmata archaeon]
MAKNEITSALDGILKDVQRLHAELQSDGMKAFEHGDYTRTKLISEAATIVDGIQRSLSDAEKELAGIYGGMPAPSRKAPEKKAARVGRKPEGVEVRGRADDDPEKKAAKVGRKPGRRAARGKKTPDHAYVAPILKALSDLGGSAKTGDVLNNVFEQMKDILNDFDMEPVPSIPSMEKWRQAAQMVRIRLVKEGLLVKDSPRGIWVISPAGREALASPEALKPAKAARPKGRRKARRKGSRRKGGRKGAADETKSGKADAD